MTDDALTPPEKCPICSQGVIAVSSDERSSDGRRYYLCGLTWQREINQHGNHFYGFCSMSTIAALRCGATLEPTPLEPALTALVDATKEWAEAYAYASVTEAIELKLWHAAKAYADLLELKTVRPNPPLVRIVSLEMTCGACPSQWEGQTDDGKYVYGRYRWGYLSLEIDGEELYGGVHGDPLAGVMDTAEFLEHVKAVAVYEPSPRPT